MPIPRFNLSTLLLGCVLVGSLLGLYLQSDQWQLCASLPVSGDFDMGLAFDSKEKRLFAASKSEYALFDIGAKKALWRVSPQSSNRKIEIVYFIDSDASAVVYYSDEKHDAHYAQFFNSEP